MKIAVISYRLPVEGEKRGGIERVAHVLADGLAHRGHTVVVFSHDRAPAGAAYEVRPLPWKSFVETWAGLRMTVGYLGNLLALQVDVREFDVVIAHGDSLLLSMGRKPVVRVMHGSARGEAVHATSAGRAVLQWGVYLQELLTAFICPVDRCRRQRQHAERQSLRTADHSARRRHRRLSAAAHRKVAASLDRVCRRGRRTEARQVSARHLRARDSTGASRCGADVCRTEGAAAAGRHVRHRRARPRSRRVVPPRVGLRGAEHVRRVRSAVPRSHGVRHRGDRHAESGQPRSTGRGLHRARRRRSSLRRRF